MNRDRILAKLKIVCDAFPDKELGALLELIEDCAWDTVSQRHCSMRLMNMPDALFEYGLDLWIKKHNLSLS